VTFKNFDLRIGEHHTPVAINGEHRIGSCPEQRSER
jgi:hypothetical protein